MKRAKIAILRSDIWANRQGSYVSMTQEKKQKRKAEEGKWHIKRQEMDKAKV